MRNHGWIAAASAIALLAVVGLPTEPAWADSVRHNQWYLKTLNIEQAHKISRGNGVTVAVIDTGVYSHPDLRENLLKGTSLVSGEEDDGRSDRAGHGTNMAALIASHGHGNSGMLGIAPAAKALPVKISNDKNNAPAAEMGRGIEWAIEQHATVINVSAGAGPAFEVQDAIAAALDSDVVVVASVGNSSESALIGYPAAIDGVLAVGATGRNGNHASLSLENTKVEICAPGEDILTAEPKRGYIRSRGTSASTAIVSGAAALVRAKFPDLSSKEVIHRLTATADDIGPPGRDDQCGFGRLNLIKALTADVPPLQGSNKSQPSPSRPSGASTPSTPEPSGNAASPDIEPAGSNSTTILFGALAALIGAGSVLAYFLLRRRRSP